MPRFRADYWEEKHLVQPVVFGSSLATPSSTTTTAILYLHYEAVTSLHPTGASVKSESGDASQSAVVFLCKNAERRHGRV